MLVSIARNVTQSVSVLPTSNSTVAAAEALAQQVSHSSSVKCALALHASILAIANDAPSDDAFSDAIESSVAAMHDTMQIPATSFTDVKLKLDLLIQEADVHVEVWDLAFLVRDLEALLGSAH